MAVKLLIPGKREPAASYGAAMRTATPGDLEKPSSGLLGNVEVVHAFSLSPAARSAGERKPEMLSVADDDILEMEIEDGFTVWTSAARYQEQVARLHPEAVGERGVDVGAIVQPSAAERGIREWATSALRVLRLKPDQITADLTDPAEWPESIQDLAQGKGTGLAGWATAKLLAYLIERRLTPGPGLYRWVGDDDLRPVDLERVQPVTAADLPQDKPLLIFIHGTASRTLGSFGALAAPDASLDWQRLRQSFGAHIYAFEHRTLSDSPIDNAIDLLAALPVGARVNLLTHSRGGLVGDLLCVDELTDAQIRAYVRREDPQEEADAHDQKQLRRLRALLRAKKLRIERYARVACPARGTLLASENIDEFLSILTNLIGLIPGLAGSPIFEVVKRFTLEVVRQRFEASVLPGIEAMTPESPIMALLNGKARASGALGVIAGDIEGGNWLKQLALFVSDRFLYESRDNDLVVNTDSMFYGAHRAEVHYVFHQGSSVSHFNYFRNESTRAALVNWVTALPGESPPEFHSLVADRAMPVPTMRAIQKRAAAPQPVVFVLPGILGSQLERDGDLVWLDYFGLLLGGLGRIRDVDDKKVKPIGLIGNYYADLCEYLSDSHRVVPFAYDWRRSIRDAGADLGKAVAEALAESNEPVRFVAHSMGGLVVRSFIAQRPQLWDDICSRPGGRLLMLGTPNLGSHSMVESLLGMATTIRQLALLDIVHSRQEILDIIAGFRGVLELLPQETETRRWFVEKFWAELRERNGDVGGLPSAAFLRDAQAALAELPVEIPNADRVLYVAGAAPSTPCGLEIDEHGCLFLLSTDAGDGRVTYENGRLPGVATWYTDALHGDLPSHETAYPAFLELLNEGRTGKLPTSPPATVRGVQAKIPYVRRSVLYPTEADLHAELLGARTRPYKGGWADGFKVSVVHGDLRHARFPIVAGHYDGDTIAGVEGYLDARLKGALSRRYELGLYAGPLNTSTVVLREPDRLERELDIPRGAVIVGLGAMGDLTHTTLAATVCRGALAYAALIEDRRAKADATAGEAAPVEIGLSLLLIGANSTSNVTVDDSVSALLRAVAQANRELAQANRATIHPSRMSLRIAEIEIVELYADVAIQAARALRELAPDIGSEMDMRVEAADLLREGVGGQIRITPSRASGQWRRWIVTAENHDFPPAQRPALPEPLLERIRATLSDPTPVDPEAWRALLGLAFPQANEQLRVATALRYVALADRARAEVRQHQGQPELIERLVNLSVRDSRFRPESARTLFELMIPNALKDTLAQLSRLVVVVDAETASYPWELMADGPSPICIEIGLVRQLQTGSFRAQVGATASNSAYVVGDPLTAEGIPPLPAAGEEARQVAAALGERFQVTHDPDRPGAMDVLDGLFARPYRIVHLAGHGYYVPGGERDPHARSGMLLENGVYLTAAEIRQMRQVPELVFLNCCHLAQTGAEARKAPNVPFNRLAASVSRELIEMGVRAVVAAGWAVRDDAANVFARTFYDEMLSGATFGDALKDARRRTWQRYPDCNTWGAYQAYGDPDYRFFSIEKAVGADHKPAWVAPEELLQALEAAPNAKALQMLVEHCPPAWISRGDVLAAIGTAYGETGDFPRAIEHLKKAVQAEDAGRGVPLSVVEQLANFEARWGERSGDPKLIERAIDRLSALIQLAESGERLSLLGSAYKLLAQATADKARATALVQAATWYRRAAERKLAGGEVDPYPVLNWLTVEAVLGNAPPDASVWLARARAVAKERFAESRSIWDAVTLPDAALVEDLLGAALGTASGDDLVAQYRTAFEETRATARQRDSVLRQLDFIVAMAPVGAIRAATINELRRIREQLAEAAASPTAEIAAPPIGRKTRKSQRTKTRPVAKRKTAKRRRKPGLS